MISRRNILFIWITLYCQAAFNAALEREIKSPKSGGCYRYACGFFESNAKNGLCHRRSISSDNAEDGVGISEMNLKRLSNTFAFSSYLTLHGEITPLSFIFPLATSDKFDSYRALASELRFWRLCRPEVSDNINSFSNPAIRCRIEKKAKNGDENEAISPRKEGIEDASSFHFPSVRLVALVAIVSVTLSAYALNVLPGKTPLATLGQDMGMSILCLALGYCFVKALTALASQNILDRRDSRKIIHLGAAPLLMLLWPFFSNDSEARWFAAVVPLVNAYRLYVAGKSREDLLRQDELVRAMSRSGDAREVLGGPFVYLLVLIASTLLFWRGSMVGVMALTTMAGGDGVADIVGRRYGLTNKWPFNDKKSVAGTTAFFAASFALSTLIWCWFTKMGVLTSSIDVADQMLRIALVCLISSLVELVPFGDDNWTVPMSGAFAAALLLR